MGPMVPGWWTASCGRTAAGTGGEPYPGPGQSSKNLEKNVQLKSLLSGAQISANAFFWGGGLCRTGSATTYAKHKSLHPPRTKNKNKPSNPTRSPSPPQQLSQGPEKATRSARGTNQEARASEHEQKKTAKQPKLKPNTATATQAEDPKATV